MAQRARAMSGLTRRGAITAGVAGAAIGALARPALAQTPAPAAAASFLTNLPGRERVALDGPWKVILDPFDVAGRKPSKRRSFWLDTIETPETGLVEYEWASSDEMQLPAAWNDVAAELTYYEGPAYFRRLLDAAPRAGWRQFLHFEAVNYAATVWLNGVEIARHEGGFTPFAVEITDLLARAGAGPHSLVVRADSRHRADTVPGLDFDWKNRGGITRSVWLVAVPETHIRDTYARLEGDVLAIDVTLDGPARGGQTVTASLAGRSARAVTDAEGRAQLRLPAKGLARWSPEAPVLHELAVTAASGRLTERIGLRTIATRGREILLNGAPVFLRGISMHEEAFGAEGARAVSPAEARALLAEAKALGCNFVRLAHYPHADHVARLADEMGLMLWAEIPVYWEEIDYASPRTLALARQMMGELVRGGGGGG
ncbi:glycoside hydrolase family 2 protein, partial [Erythrobacter sp. W302b]|uniref:glycoside hydrolase family 2 protein n=1 Tax=Erythrobacter sp. W302b TaxID=3389874 RepID=UPI00396B37E6